MSLHATLEVDSAHKLWLTFLNDLSNMGVEEDVSIPQIAVIGDQSSGKSSLLSSLSNIPFPRGTGLVTRVPTIIALQGKVTDPESPDWKAEVSVISASRGKTSNIPGTGPCSHPAELADRITQLTDALAGGSAKAGFSRDSIFIKVEAIDVPNLILVDLPGIVRTTTSGQSKTVISEIDDMLYYFMRQPNTIILAVVPANQDIATVDVLERAKKIDPHGSRTIGVLTKPDLVESGAEDEVMLVLNNVRKPLALGYVIVKNKSTVVPQQDNSSSSSNVGHDVGAEERYFADHPRYKHIAKESRGCAALSRKLTACLVNQAKEALPFMKYELERRLVQIEKGLQEVGGDVPIEESERRDLLMQMVSRFGQTLRRISLGDYYDELTINMDGTSSSSSSLSADSLRIKFLVSEISRQLRDRIARKVPDFDSDDYSMVLLNALSSLRGRELPGFMSARLLMGSLSLDLDHWRVEVEDAFHQALLVYMATSEQLSKKLASKFPKVREALMGIVDGCITLQIGEMSRRTEEIFERGAGGSINDQEMVSSINQVRYERFERALEEVMGAASENKSNGTTSDKQSKVQSSSSSSGREKDFRTKEMLRQHVVDNLGRSYMKHHAIGTGPASHIEDARAALRAYWRLSESRLYEDVVSCLELVLLQRGSELIEQTLLSEAQGWVADTKILTMMLSEDPDTVTKRRELRDKKHRLELALQKITDLDPGCKAQEPVPAHSHMISHQQGGGKHHHNTNGSNSHATNTSDVSIASSNRGHNGERGGGMSHPVSPMSSAIGGAYRKTTTTSTATTATLSTGTSSTPPPLPPAATSATTVTRPTVSSIPGAFSSASATVSITCRRPNDVPQDDDHPSMRSGQRQQQAPLSEEELTQLRSIPSLPELAAEVAGEGVALFRLPDYHTSKIGTGNSSGNNQISGNDNNSINSIDNCGLVFWLGTRGYLRPFKSPMSFGQLNVTSSGLACGNEDSIVCRIPHTECCTTNTVGCWICVDVGRSRALRLTHITVTHGSSLPGHDLIAWACEGRDPLTSQWISLADLPILRSKHGQTTIAIDTKGCMYSQLRLISTGKQQDGTHALHISHIELYGLLVVTSTASSR